MINNKEGFNITNLIEKEIVLIEKYILRKTI